MSRLGLRTVLACMAWGAATAAAEDDMERAQLAALDRQLEVLGYAARRSESLAQHADRYHFDYARLHADLARIREGIDQHLNPARAQPREPAATPAEATP